MNNINIPESVKRGIECVKKKKLVLIYDAEDREGETDFVIPASFVTSKKSLILEMRQAGLYALLFILLRQKNSVFHS